MRNGFRQRLATEDSASSAKWSRTSPDQVIDTVGVARHGGGPSIVYGGKALRAFDGFHYPPIPAE